jgi:fructan beta-fructosidase
MKRACIFIMMLSSLFSFAQQKVEESYKEKYRPQYHFSPQKGWIGDPDGLVYSDGKYHLYWWGHAISEDLVHWKELPYPMKGGDGKFSYFSGSVVVDRKNTSGFGENSMIAFYTKHLPGDTIPETQAISVSNDQGVSYNYYQNNPVLDINKIFFRDPQVFWFDKDQKWKMVVSLPDIQQIHIYESKDLKEWNFCSSFGGLGAVNSFWECPDLFEVPVLDQQGKTKWVMLIGRGPNRVQYFVGDFDGKTFVADQQVTDYLENGKGLNGVVFDDFENDVASNWQIKGDAFLKNKRTDQQRDYIGKDYFGNLSSNEKTGTARSKSFKITSNAINFLIAGGENANSLTFNLVVEGKVQRTATADKTQVFKWNGWDVRDLKGKNAYLSLVDDVADSVNGAIAVDHILFSDDLLNQQLEHALWLDYGTDFYATRTWRNYDDPSNLDGKVYAIGWMGNWDYARQAPTSWGKGFQSLPRIMSLKQHTTGYRIVQQPIPQLKQLRETLASFKGGDIKKNTSIEPFKPTKNTYEVDVTLKPDQTAEFGLNLLVGAGRKLVLHYNPKTSILCLDRTNCTDFLSNEKYNSVFAKKMYAPVSLDNGVLKLHIFVDQASVEIFTNDGEVVLSAVTYPSEEQLGVQFYSNEGNTEIVSLDVWNMKSIW